MDLPPKAAGTWVAIFPLWSKFDAWHLPSIWPRFLCTPQHVAETAGDVQGIVVSSAASWVLPGSGIHSSRVFPALLKNLLRLQTN